MKSRPLPSPLLLLFSSACLGTSLFMVGGCSGSGGESAEPAFVATPQAAVETATPLLRMKDWAGLARYYDLGGSSVARTELVNGSYFFGIRAEGERHPAGLSDYKHPFAPGFRFLRSEPGPQPDIVKVVVQIEIDQGAGSPPQRGLSAFLLRKSARGFQFLPIKAEP